MIDGFDDARVEFDAVAVALAWALAFRRPVVWFCVVYVHVCADPQASYRRIRRRGG